jgi:hypothetical protein
VKAAQNGTARVRRPTHRAGATVIRFPDRGRTEAPAISGPRFGRLGVPALLAVLLIACCIGWEAAHDLPPFGADQREAPVCVTFGPSATPVCVAIK